MEHEIERELKKAYALVDAHQRSLAKREPTPEEVMSEVMQSVEALTLEQCLKPWTANIGTNLHAGIGRSVTEFDLPEDRKKETVFIVGPGASMDQYKDVLPELRDHGTIVMQPTAYPWMHKIGLEPDVIVLVDHMPSQATLIKGCTCPVIAPLTCDPAIAENDVYWFSLYQGDGSPTHPRWGLWNIMAHFLPKTTYGSSGWVSAADVTNMATILAAGMITGTPGIVKLPAKRIVLVGVDRAFYDGYARVPWEGLELEKFTEDHQAIKFRGVDTTTAMVFYMQRLYELWPNLGVPLYRYGWSIMREIPKVDPKWIKHNKWPKPLVDQEKIIKRIRPFMDHEFMEEFPWTWGDRDDVMKLMGKVNDRDAAGVPRSVREAEKGQ